MAADRQLEPTSSANTHPASLRLWPGLVAVVLGLTACFAPVVAPDGLAGEATAVAVMGVSLAGVLVVLWWTFSSRAPRGERWGGTALVLLGVASLFVVAHRSIATGMMGWMPLALGLPTVALALFVWAAAVRRRADGARWGSLAAAVALGAAPWVLVRTEGMSSTTVAFLRWRWSDTAEEQLLSAAGGLPGAPRVNVRLGEDDDAGEPEWPGFRGPGRDGDVRGVRVETDWDTTPPTPLWRRAVGPGWSSFAVDGDVFYTQEQRGEEEIVACYTLATGEPVWSHADPVRFWESNAGAGPRGTPALHAGRVHALGATGVLNTLDARDGRVLWSRDAAADAGAELPEWGFSSSPLVVRDLVVVAASGALLAYDAGTGALRWKGPYAGAGRTSYGSPHLVAFEGVEQVVLSSDEGAIGVAPEDGALLWELPWSGDPIVQPALTPDGELLLSVSSFEGLVRVAVKLGPEGWAVEPRWRSIRLKPYFNDFVVHGEHAYGFDGSLLACIELRAGERRWKGGRYGNGQLVLLADQDVLLVLSEEGELALVRAEPDAFQELARFPALEGKTWNHPVLVGDVLLVRNDREMAAFRLALAGA